MPAYFFVNISLFLKNTSALYFVGASDHLKIMDFGCPINDELDLKIDEYGKMGLDKQPIYNKIENICL